MAALVQAFFAFLCILLVPGTFCRHILSQEPSTLNERVRKSTKPQRSRADLTEERPPHLRFRQVPPPSVSVTELGSVVLECEVGGNPPPTIHWLKNGRRLTVANGDSNQVIRDEESAVVPVLGISVTRSRLYLDCVMPSDESTYTCVAENPYLRIASEIELTVRPSALIATAEEGIAAATGELCLSKKSFGSPARIHMWTHSRLEVQGNDAQLFCRSTGLPKPTVLWVGPEKKSIVSGPKYQILPSGDLLIRDLVWDDLGRYLCQAENERGSDQMTTFLYPAAQEQTD